MKKVPISPGTKGSIPAFYSSLGWFLLALRPIRNTPMRLHFDLQRD